MHKYIHIPTFCPRLRISLAATWLFAWRCANGMNVAPAPASATDPVEPRGPVFSALCKSLCADFEGEWWTDLAGEPGDMKD